MFISRKGVNGSGKWEIKRGCPKLADINMIKFHGNLKSLLHHAWRFNSIFELANFRIFASWLWAIIVYTGGGISELYKKAYTLTTCM